MNKKSLFGTLALCMIAPLVASCGSTATGTSLSPAGSAYFQINQDDYKVTFNQLRTAYVYATEANQKGDVKALVVPVDFTDYSAESLPAGAEGTREDIQKAIFGDPETDPEINWESLHSFYQKSSYGQCNITGTVAPWFHTNKTAYEFEKDYTVDLLVGDIYNYYSDVDYDGDINIDDYDANNDKYIDLLLMVYACPTGSKIGGEIGKNSKVYWAYTTQYPMSKNGSEYFERPQFSRYWWTSIEFMYNDNGRKPFDSHGKFDTELAEKVKNNTAKIDSHTFIHETGHGLGLADYYSYDYNGDSPMGGLDMMDNNIGDHNAYSKALYGWISPTVIQDSCEVTIRPFGETGDALLVPIRELDWKNNSYTLLDEYLTIEYDTPYGLAVADGLDSYDGVSPLYYTEPGVRILHTDSRMGHWYQSKNEKGEYEKTFHSYTKSPYVAGNEEHWSDFAHDNSLSRTANGNRLLEVIKPYTGSPLGYERHLSGPVNNQALWKEGMKMGNMVMNTGKETGNAYKLGFDIEIVKITEEGATIRFTAK